MNDTVHIRPSAHWTIDDLTAKAAQALSVDYEGQSNGQISDVPNRRTIRYYTTLGLLDRPAAMRGRTALYGRRHLLQLVAIKRLQLDGLSLSEVQERLAGATTGTLEVLARLPELPAEAADADLDANADPLGDIATLDDEEAAAPGVDRRTDFWHAAPAELAEPAPAETEADAGSGPRAQAIGVTGSASVPSTPSPARLLQGLDLAPGVTLLLSSERPLDATETAALEAAAAPLLSTLRALGLAAPRLRGDES